MPSIRPYRVTNGWNKFGNSVPMQIILNIRSKLVCRKQLLYLALAVITLATFVLIYLLYNLNRNRSSIIVHTDYDEEDSEIGDRQLLNDSLSWLIGRHNTYGFHPVNDKGVYSFWNVCIEALNPPVRRSIEFLGKSIYFNETKKIVVYNSFYRDGMQKLFTSGSSNSAWNHWDVYFMHDPIPSTHKFQTNTVYFIAQTCPANIHHFWIDEFVPLYTVVRQANKLRLGARNQILYRRPSGLLDEETAACSNQTLYEPILMTLYTEKFHDVFYNMKENTCFSSGVFGTTAYGLIRPRDVVEHVLLGLNVSLLSNSPNYVTFIQRTNRLIQNIDELVLVAKTVGFRKIRVVQLENLSVLSQMRIASSSSIMVGVQGAGLQWAVFMQEGSTLIEVAWPYKHWGFYFQNYVRQYGIDHIELTAQNVQVNWTSYERFMRGGRHVAVDERIQLLQQPPKNTVDNLWKFADVWVNRDDFLGKLLNLELKTASRTRPMR